VSGRVLGVAAAVLVAVVLAAYGVTGALKVRDMRREIDAAEREIAQLRAETRKLGEQIDRLRHDPEYIEKLAREERGMVRSGETVLKFPSRPR
jgi:cell division protein FtsB